MREFYISGIACLTMFTTESIYRHTHSNTLFTSVHYYLLLFMNSSYFVYHYPIYDILIMYIHTCHYLYTIFKTHTYFMTHTQNYTLFFIMSTFVLLRLMPEYSIICIKFYTAPTEILYVEIKPSIQVIKIRLTKDMIIHEDIGQQEEICKIEIPSFYANKIIIGISTII